MLYMGFFFPLFFFWGGVEFVIIKNFKSLVCLSNQEGPAFDFGELQEAIVLQGVKFRNDEATKARMLLLPLLSLSFFSSCDV